MQMTRVFCLLALVAVASAQITILDLAFDTSGSVNSTEFNLMKNSTVQVVCHRDIVPLDGTVALGAYEWSSPSQQTNIAAIRIINSQADLDTFGQLIKNWVRAHGATTAVAAAINHAADTRFPAFITANPSLSIGRKVIDIVKDGNENQSGDIVGALTNAANDNILINCLAIGNINLCNEILQAPNNDPSVFAVAANGFEDFERAFEEKFVREVNEDPVGCTGACDVTAACTVQAQTETTGQVAGTVAKLCFNSEAPCPKV